MPRSVAKELIPFATFEQYSEYKYCIGKGRGKVNVDLYSALS